MIEDEPFEFDGASIHLRGAFTNPKPVQRPRPPALVLNIDEWELDP